MKKIEIIIDRGKKKGKKTYFVPFTSRMRILGALFYIQENLEPDLAFRWNCGEGICGSCAAEINGKPVLMCKEEIKSNAKKIIIEPMKAFPTIKDLVTDPAQVYLKLEKLKPYFTGKKKKGEFYKINENEVEEVQAMRKCIDCFICYDSCHVVRDHPSSKFPGPMNILKAASLDKHPKEEFNRSALLEKEGIWNCNISRCCTQNCPQGIRITDDAIIPEKEKSVDDTASFKALIKKIRGKYGFKK